MEYPIFNSIVNQIKEELNKIDVKIGTFRTWSEYSINASGLEFTIDLNDRTDYLKNININIDWDKFREIRLANQLEGMEKHPLLKKDTPSVTNVRSILDIEVVWNLNESIIHQIAGTAPGNHRLDLASNWMDNINQYMNDVLSGNEIMSRWHVELEGDELGRYVSVMNFISYFQHNFDNVSSINEIHVQVMDRIRSILRLNKRIEFYTKATVPKTG